MLPGDRDDEEAVEDLVDNVEIGDAIDFGHQDVGVEARVLGAVDQIAEKAFDVGGVRRSADDENRRGVGRLPVAGRVADGAIVRHAWKTDGFLAEAGRQFLALFPGNAERGVATGKHLAVLRQLFGKDARQDVEDPVGDAGVVLGADRSVLEACLEIGAHPVGLRVFAEATVPGDPTANDHGDNDHHADGAEPGSAGSHAHRGLLRRSS